MTTRIGPRQRDILERMKGGASLEQDGWGMFRFVVENERSWHAPSHICVRLHERGLIGEDKREEHPGYRGGVRVWYTLTEQGKKAIE